MERFGASLWDDDLLPLTARETIQHDLESRYLTTRTSRAANLPWLPTLPFSSSSTMDTLLLLALLNLPAFVYVQSLWKRSPRARQQLIRRGNVFTLADINEPATDPRLLVREKVASFLDMFALKPGQVWQKPWTLLTSSFVHVDLKHFGGNMASYAVLVKPLSRAHRFNGLHACCITIGSSLVSSAVSLAGHKWSTSRTSAERHRPTYSFGFSGVLCAFSAIVTALHPSPAAALPILYDLYGAITQLMLPESNLTNPPTILGQQRVGHIAHLAGAGFGFAYYWTFLRRRL